MLLAAVAVVAIQAAPVAQDKIVLGVARKPTPRGRPQAWITDDDYPASAVRTHAFGAVGFRLDVDAQGHVTACHVTRSSGYAALDDGACRLLARRAEFNPAQDGAGKNIPFTYNGTFTWNLPAGRGGESPVNRAAGTPVDLAVGLQGVPKGYSSPALLRLVFADGKATSCTVEQSSGDARLDAVACAQAEAKVTPLVVGKPGWAEPDSRMVSVAFEAAK